jgi:outer membrane protein assembly factor BamA
MDSDSDPTGPVSRDLSGSLRDIFREPVRLQQIIIRGTERTHLSYVENVLSASLSGDQQSAPGPTGSVDALTFGQLLERASLATERLRQTECFRAVDVLIDESTASVTDETKLATVPCDAIVTLREASPFSLRVGATTDTRTGESSLELDGGLINFTGTGDSLHCQLGAGLGASGVAITSLGGLAALVHPNRYLFSKQTASNHLVCSWRKPHPWGLLDTLATARLESALLNRMDTSSYNEFQRSLEVGIQTPVGRFAYECSWRELGQVAPHASIRVREQAGHSVKSSLKYAWVQDSRDDPLAPREGTASQWSCELSGLGGDPATRFVRSEVSWQSHIPLAANLTGEEAAREDESTESLADHQGMMASARTPLIFSIGAQAGIILPLQKVPSKLRRRQGEHHHMPGYPVNQPRICDRFFLGGSANAFRGFRNRGLGPNADGDAIGGDLYYKVGLHLGVPMPLNTLARSLGLQFHAFCTAGDCREWSDLASWRQTWRLTAGLGLVCCTSLGRFELNWGRALRHGVKDRFDDGFSISFFQSFSP